MKNYKKDRTDKIRKDREDYLKKRKKNLTKKEFKDIASLEDELISKKDEPKRKTYKGCIRRGSDKDKVKKLKTLRVKALGKKEN